MQGEEMSDTLQVIARLTEENRELRTNLIGVGELNKSLAERIESLESGEEYRLLKERIQRLVECNLKLR
jgi:hypothetical protein